MAESFRAKSLPSAVIAAGGIDAWNAQSTEVATLDRMLDNACSATTIEDALKEVKAFMLLGHNLWAYAYMRRLYNKDPAIYYGTLLADPITLLPVVYTPTVGEACQKFGLMPMYRRGCYISSGDAGNIRSVLEEYAAAELERGPDGKPMCDCIVFSDGGRILGLGDLGAWGMGIPIGKLDLYTVCAGVNPNRTIPAIIDAGCQDPKMNTANLVIRDHERYTGQKQDRAITRSAAGTAINRCYYGEGNLIEEFMSAATDIFGKNCLLQFEDFNSNDAFPLLAEYREKYVSYNDDIQGTASVTVAGLMGAAKLKKPGSANLRNELKSEKFLFAGAGAANLGTMNLLMTECNVPKANIFVTNSRGVIWKSADGSDGNFRNDEQKEFAVVGKPSYNPMDLPQAIKEIKPSCLIGAVGRAPNCFNKPVIEAMVTVNKPHRPVVFALSNPKTQAEIGSEDCYAWSGGTAIYGSGTQMPYVDVDGQNRQPAQVNNVYIFPGVSMGTICCQAKSVPESFFIAAAEAVANTLDVEDMRADRVLPNQNRIRQVGLNVAVAVVLEAQKLGLAQKPLGATQAEVDKAVREQMWVPQGAEDIASKAVAVRMQVAAANRDGGAKAVRKSGRQLPVDSELNEHLASKVKNRAVVVSIDAKRPRFVAGEQIPASPSLAKDFELVSALLDGKKPLGILLRLKDDEDTLAGAIDIDWLVIVYIPEGLKQREKLSWMGTADSFISNYPEKRIAEWRITKKEEVSYFAFLEAAKAVLSITGVVAS